MKRSSGVLMHVSMLWGDYSIGSFGKSAKQFIDFLSDCGFSYWQILPIGVSDDWNSPYKAYSAFAGNPYFIDLEILLQNRLLTEAELEASLQRTPYVCEYERLKNSRLKYLRKASERVNDDLRAKIEAYIEGNKSLRDFCVFMALKEANGDAEWVDFRIDKYDEKTLFMWKFIQYEFFREWGEIKRYANEKGISIIGDIPMYISHDSSDVFFNRELFDLDKDGRPKNIAGVPPDYFSADGQLWGNPLYDWKRMRTDGYTWWRERIRYNLDIFDSVRIDHFRGFESFWSVPADAPNAKNGRWLRGGGKEFVKEIRRFSEDTLIIAEDLGEITPAVRKLVDYSGFSGMRVFQFGHIGDADSPHLPHNYPYNCVAYSGTHDNNTLLGYIWELASDTRRRVSDYCGYYGNDFGELCRYIIKTIFASHAQTVIFPIQDILGYGSDTRMNTPGIAAGNWSVRFTYEQINGIDRSYFRHLNELYGRCGK